MLGGMSVVIRVLRTLSAHAEVYNLFNLGRHLLSVKNYRMFRVSALASWNSVVAI